MRKIKVTLDNGKSTIATFEESMTQEEVIKELNNMIPSGTNIVSATQIVDSKKSPEEIKARGEEAYKQMQADIDTERERQEVKDKYGWFSENPTANLAMSVLAPSSMESIDAGEIPSVSDIGIDVATNAAGLVATPERIALGAGRVLPKLGRLLAPSASRLKNIAVGALEQGAISGASEGLLSTKHDRDYSLTAPLVGTVGGGAIGATATTSMAKKLLDAGYPQDEIAGIMKKLGTTEKGTLNAIGRGGAGSTDQLGVTDVKIPLFVDDVLAPIKEWDSYKAYKTIGTDAALSPVRKSIDKVTRLPNLSLNSKEKTLVELQELEDIFYKKLIKADDFNRKFADNILTGEAGTIAQKSDINVDELYKTITRPETTIPLAGYVKDIEETVTDPNIRRSLIADVAKAAGEESALKGLLDKGKYEAILEKTPDVIESGTILGTAKNVLESAPHSIGTARTVLKAPIAVGERVKDRQEVAKEEPPKYTNRSGYTSQGDLLYAPRGYITYEDLWAEAPKKKNK